MTISEISSGLYTDYIEGNVTVNSVMAQAGGSFIGRSVSEMLNDGISVKRIGALTLGCATIAAAYFNQTIAGSQNSTLVSTVAAVNVVYAYHSTSNNFAKDKLLKELGQQQEELEQMRKTS